MPPRDQVTDKTRNIINEWSGALAIAAMILSPLITYAVASATHGQRLQTLENEVGSLRSNQDVNAGLLREILQRLSRIEAKLEK